MKRQKQKHPQQIQKQIKSQGPQLKIVKVKLIEVRLRWDLYRSNLCEPRNRGLGYTYNITRFLPTFHPPHTHTQTHTHATPCLFSEISEGFQLNCSYHMLISPKPKMQTTSKLTVKKGKLIWGLTGYTHFLPFLLVLCHFSCAGAIKATVGLSPASRWLSICCCLPTVLNHSVPLQATPLIDHSRGAASQNVDSTQ